MKCQYPDCTREGKYYMGWWGDGEKKWGKLCRTHDSWLGKQNLVEHAYMTMEEAASYNANLIREEAI